MSNIVVKNITTFIKSIQVHQIWIHCNTFMWYSIFTTQNHNSKAHLQQQRSSFLQRLLLISMFPHVVVAALKPRQTWRVHSPMADPPSKQTHFRWIPSVILCILHSKSRHVCQSLKNGEFGYCGTRGQVNVSRLILILMTALLSAMINLPPIRVRSCYRLAPSINATYGAETFIHYRTIDETLDNNTFPVWLFIINNNDEYILYITNFFVRFF